VTADTKVPGQFQLALTKGASFLSVRALARKAATTEHSLEQRTYVFELFESDSPVLSLNLEAPLQPAVAPAPEVGPTGCWRCWTKQSVPAAQTAASRERRDVDFTTYDAKPLVSDFDDYEIRIEEAFRFNPEDTLVFRVVVTNKTDASCASARTASPSARATGSTTSPSATPPARSALGAAAPFISPLPGTPDAGATSFPSRMLLPCWSNESPPKDRHKRRSRLPGAIAGAASVTYRRSQGLSNAQKTSPEVVADVEVVAYADHATDFIDYEVRLDEGYHFSRDDTLVCAPR